MQDEIPVLIRKLQKSMYVMHSPLTAWVILVLSLIATFSAYWLVVVPSNIEAEGKLYLLAAGVVVDLLLFYVIFSSCLFQAATRSTAQKLQQQFDISQEGLNAQSRLVAAVEKESETFFEMAPDAFLVVSKAGLIVKANQYAHDMFGYDQGELLEMYLEALVPDDLKKAHSNMRYDYFLKPSARLMSPSRKLFGQKKDGEKIPISVNLEPIEFRGDIHIVAAVHDVTVQRKTEKKLADAKDRAEDDSRSKSDFVANMSHEIRTPLNAVLGAAQLLGKTEPSSTQGKYINMILDSGEALLGVINDILDFSKIEAGCMVLSFSSFNLSDVLSRVAVMMSVNSGGKDIELVIHVGLDVQNKLFGDPLRLQQVLINLVSNALKFTDKGSVILTVDMLERSDEGVQKLKFTVSDTGIGMTSEQRVRLFGAFTQADESITRRFGGTGLGLLISSRIVALMGSNIEVVSQVDKGSEFSFVIESPVERDEAPKVEFLYEQKRKVLLIDDNAATRASVKEIASGWEWDLWSYDSWSQAQESLIGAQLLRELDFVILDWSIPAVSGVNIISNSDLLDGASVLVKLRDMGLRDDCAAVLTMSNNQCASIVMGGIQKTFDVELVKPILESSLLNSLQEASMRRTGQPISPMELGSIEIGDEIRGASILLVEDNIFNQTIAQGLLEDMGAKVNIANNGLDALELYKKEPDKYDVILMDVQMPIMGGVMATKKLREDLACKLPIIAMTAGVLMSERDEYLKSGMSDFVPKPIDENELFGAINRALTSVTSAKLKFQEVKVEEEVSKPAREQQLVFNSRRLELLSKGKSNRVKSIVDSIETMALSGEQSLLAGWVAVESGDRPQAHFLFHNFKGQVANYGAEVLASSIQCLEKALGDNVETMDIKPLFGLITQDFHEFIQRAELWVDKQRKIFEEDF